MKLNPAAGAPSDYRFPFPPFPTGWYCLCFSQELPPGGIQHGQWLGRERVLYRTQAGVPRLVDAYCPHMGAHFGHGGTVEGETLRCPFHSFLFDGEGACVKTPYGHPPPPKAKLETWPVVEVNGLVLFWHDELGRPPSFEIPALPEEELTPLKVHAWVVRTHPQETTENIVDLGHLGEVHGYGSVELVGTPEKEGPVWGTRVRFLRPTPFPGGSPLKAGFYARAFGLGVSLVEAEVPEQGLKTRQWVLPTPIDGERIHLRIGLAISPVRKPWKIFPLLAPIPGSLATRIIHKGAMDAYINDVSQDLAIWENKRYLHPAVLARGDGPVGAYRQWARQFYPSLTGEV